MNQTQDNFFLIKQLAPFLKPFRLQVTVILAFVPFIAALQGAQPYLLKKTVDQISKGQIDNLWFYPGILAVVLLISLILKVIQNFLVQSVGQRFVSDIREKLFEHLQSLSIDFFETNQTGKLITRLTNDIEALSEMFASGLVGGANDVFSLLGIGLFMLFIDWRFTVIQFLLIPLLMLLTNRFEKFYRNASADSRRELAQLNSLFQESLLGLAVIKLFNRQNALEEKFAEVNNRYIVANNKSIAADSAFSALIELVGLVGILLVIFASILLIKGVTAGNLVAFVSYSQMLFGPIRSLSEKFATFQAGFTSAERIVGILSEKPSITTEASDDVSWKAKGSTVEFNSVSFKYKPEAQDYILQNISFNLQEGHSLGIVGQTGSGKSTLIKLLCRFYDPNEGRILIGGQDLRTIEPSALRKHVLMIPQRSFLFSGTLYDNLVLDKSHIPHNRIEEACEKTGLIEIVRSLPQGLNTELREGGVDLSSGQKQLISLTRAIIQEPQILILDEATASLDTHTEGLVTGAIKQILQSGKTVIFIAHRLNLVTECNQIIVLQKGHIKELGTHDELIAQGGYYTHLFELSTLI